MKHSLSVSAASLPAVFDLLARALRSGEATAQAPRGQASRRTLLERIEQAAWRARQRDLERHLGKAVDACDLEDRIARLARTPLWPYY